MGRPPRAGPRLAELSASGAAAERRSRSCEPINGSGLAGGGSGSALDVLLFASFFEGLPQDLFDAARVDGANFIQTFRLMLPLARPIIAVVVILQFMHSWNDFNIPLVFTLVSLRG